MVQSGHNGVVIQDSSFLQCKEDCRSYESYLGKTQIRTLMENTLETPAHPKTSNISFFSDEI